MAQLFVSHSSADNELAAKVKDSLADLGYESVFLDFDPTGGLVPGQAWRDQLFTNLDACDAVVFITSPTSIASQWCHSELALTRWLRKPILALLVDGSDPHPLTADLQGWIAMRAWVSRYAAIHTRYEPVFHSLESDRTLATVARHTGEARARELERWIQAARAAGRERAA